MIEEKGFTLIELILVIAIVAILAGAMVPLINTSRQDARFAKTSADLDMIKTACVVLHADTSSWPADASNGSGLLTNASISGWNGPYIDDWDPDPWGNPYRIYNGTGSPVNLTACSNGTNKVFNNCTGDDNRTILTSDRSK